MTSRLLSAARASSSIDGTAQKLNILCDWYAFQIPNSKFLITASVYNNLASNGSGSSSLRV